MATSVAISIGGAGAGGDADATITTGVEAYAGSGATLSAGQDILIKAASDYDATADVYGIAVGMARCRGSVTTANANGAVTSRMDGSVTKGRDVTIEANADSTADAEAFALAGGILYRRRCRRKRKCLPHGERSYRRRRQPGEHHEREQY